MRGPAMRPPRVVGGMSLLIIAIFVALYYIIGKSLMREGANEYLDKHAPKVKQLLNDALAKPDAICIYEGPFPYLHDSQDSARVFGKRCDRCEDLYEAGLLTKTIAEQINDRGQKYYATRYDLTEFGKSVYAEEPETSSSQGTSVQNAGRKVPRFCFGKTALHKVIEMIPPMTSGGNTYLGLEYVAEIVDPHPFLYDPASKPLHLPVPDSSRPALYPPQVATIVTYPDGTMEIDNSFRYGKYVNR